MNEGALPSLYNCEVGDVGINVCKVRELAWQNKLQEARTAGMAGSGTVECREEERFQRQINSGCCVERAQRLSDCRL